MSPAYLHEQPDGVVLSVRVAPRSSQSKVQGVIGSEVKIALQAAPVDGQANQELIQLLAKTLKISKSNIEIVRGETARNKTVFLRGVTAAQCKAALKL
ncbi:MAG: DUF167 domain-containing protein [Candidatus Hinthialibacter antarcticus]|nr:DUF167 domain-containing protein [Candidatus Hinthialibacter antarcticus]